MFTCKLPPPCWTDKEPGDRAEAEKVQSVEVSLIILSYIFCIVISRIFQVWQICSCQDLDHNGTLLPLLKILQMKFRNPQTPQTQAVSVSIP